MVLGIVKASLEILGIVIGVKKWYCSGLVHTITKRNRVLGAEIPLMASATTTATIFWGISKRTKGAAEANLCNNYH